MQCIMKFTQEQIKQIIKEEIEKYVFEAFDFKRVPTSDAPMNKKEEWVKDLKSNTAAYKEFRDKTDEAWEKKSAKQTLSDEDLMYLQALDVFDDVGLKDVDPYGTEEQSLSQADFDKLDSEKQFVDQKVKELESRSITGKAGWSVEGTLDTLQAWAGTVEAVDVQNFVNTLGEGDKNLDFFLRFGEERPDIADTMEVGAARVGRVVQNMEALADMDEKGELLQPKLSVHQKIWKKLKPMWKNLKSQASSRIVRVPPGFQRADIDRDDPAYAPTK